MPGSQGCALDLFCGTGSVGDQLKKRGFSVVSLDFQRSAKADFSVDILEWDYRKAFEPGHFAIIAAGVPCTEYSIALTTRPRNLEQADKIVAKTLEIIAYFRPKMWWIENPRFGLLKERDIMSNIKFIDVDYCQFSEWGYKKPTRIWCCEQIAQLNDVLCDKRTCNQVYTTPQGQTRHKERLGGNNMGFTARLKGRTPPLLVDYLLSAVSLKVGAPRAPQTPKAKEMQEGEVALEAEFPPSWSDAETVGGGS